MSLRSTLQRWRSTLAARRANVPFAVHFDESGVTQASRSGPVQMPWQAITAVFAYKRDCYTVDQIRVILGDEASRRWMEVTENDEGYSELVAELPRSLPGCLGYEEWFLRVAFPPFETQWTQLYKR